MENLVPDYIFKRIIKNTLFLYISTFIGQLTAFLLLPIIVDRVGKPDFGLYVLVLSVPPLLSFLDFGMSTAVIKLLAPLDRNRDKDRINEILIGVLLLRVVSGLLMGGCLWIISYKVSRFFNLEQQNIATAAHLFRIIAVFVALNWTLLIFRSVVFARERFEIDTVAVIVSSLSGFILAIVLLHIYGTIEATTCGLLGGQLLGNLVYFIGSWKLLPHLAISRRHINLRTLKNVYGFGGKIFIMSVCSSALYQLDKMLLGIFRNMTQVGEFGVADTLHQIPRTVNLLSTNAIMPAISNLEAKNEWGKIHGIVSATSKIVVALVYPVTLYLLFFAEPFIVWYVGPDFRVSAPAARVYVLYLLFYAHTGVIGNVLVGVGRVNFLVAQNVVVLICKIVLSLLLIPRYGLMGAVLSTTIVISLSMPIFVVVGLRILKDSISNYAKNVIVPHILPLAAVCLFCLFARPYIAPRFPHLFAAASAVFVIYQCLFYYLGLRGTERRSLWGYIKSLANRENPANDEER